MDGSTPVRPPAQSMPAIDIATKTALEAFYREHFRFVWRSLRRLGVEAADLEDASQDVFLVAHRRREESATWESPRAWLYGVARRVAADRRRGRARYERKLAGLPAAHPQRPLDEAFDDGQRLDALAAAIAELPEIQRDVYVLVELEGLHAREAAEALGIVINTVYSRLHRARVAIDRRLGHVPDEEEPP